jgi:hypothetical protein
MRGRLLRSEYAPFVAIELLDSVELAALLAEP